MPPNFLPFVNRPAWSDMRSEWLRSDRFWRGHMVMVQPYRCIEIAIVTNQRQSQNCEDNEIPLIPRVVTPYATSTLEMSPFLTFLNRWVFTCATDDSDWCKSEAPPYADKEAASDQGTFISEAAFSKDETERSHLLIY
ncbi:unnamed protein product [Soboliphyme baturini]|uniref:Uncharacterized protein n=1 Tax=Soboliphyme baturini TaxID=241478 RepID=A0A183J2B6_9BILA|nr:unnamed protein product [Soboliphyme baturini]